MRHPDKQLILNAKNGDTSAYEALFEKYQSGIYNFSYSILGNTEDAKDITQEAFIKIYEALPRLDENFNFSAYLYKTTRNLSIDELKRKKRFASPELIDIEKDLSIYSDPQRSALFEEQQTGIRKAAIKLSEDYRTALYLKEIQDKSYDEISSIMEIPKNSVGVLLMRARLKLKEEYRMSQVDVEKLTKECKKMLPLLSAYIDNELSVEKRKKVDRHLKDCPLCRLALEEMTEASESYRGLIPLIPPINIKNNILSKVKDFNKTTSLSTEKTLVDKSMEITQKISSGGEKASKGLLGKFAGLSVAKKSLIITSALIVLLGLAGGSFYGLWNLMNVSKSEDNKQMQEDFQEDEQSFEDDFRVEDDENIIDEPVVDDSNKIEEATEHKAPEEDNSQTTTTTRPQTETDQTDLIRQAIISRMKQDGIEPEEFNITNINYTGNKATASAINIDPYEDSLTFELEKINDQWVVINYGTG